MELASQMKAMALKVQVEWTPCSGNPDELANGNTARFSPALRVGIEPGELSWKILPEVLQLGREAEDVFDEAKKNGAPLNRGRRQKSKRAGSLVSRGHAEKNHWHKGQ